MFFKLRLRNMNDHHANSGARACGFCRNKVIGPHGEPQTPRPSSTYAQNI